MVHPPMLHSSPKFRENRCHSFCVILLTVKQTSLVPLVPHPCALGFHISLAGQAACSITFNYPPCQQTDSTCLLPLVIGGFRGQVIRSWLHCHPTNLPRPQGAYAVKELANFQSVTSFPLQCPGYCLVWSRCTYICYSTVTGLDFGGRGGHWDMSPSIF